MYKSRLMKVVRREREGLVSHFLLQKSDIGKDNLAVSWVEVDPGAAQKLHRHQPEQVYIIMQGQGRMSVGEEIDSVVEGDMIYIPTNVSHGLTNTGAEKLKYISVSTPAFDIAAVYDTGDLSPCKHQEGESSNSSSSMG